MTVTMELIKTLRERTSAGLADCKKALQETSGNIEEAVDWLRKKGIVSASKKSGRTAAEGVVCVVSGADRCTVIELNSETDFVARNEKFQEFAKKTADIACSGGYCIDSLKDAPMNSSTVQEELASLIGVINENMNLRRVDHLSEKDGVVATYVHNKLNDYCGTIGVLVSVKGSDKDKALAFGKKVAMHIAASAPLALDRESVNPSDIEREKEIAKEKQRALGKGEDVMEKIAEGAVKKFYKDSVLLEQPFVLDTSKTVEQAAAEEGLKITGFVRYQLGEGIEKNQVDFAAEVQAQLK